MLVNLELYRLHLWYPHAIIVMPAKADTQGGPALRLRPWPTLEYDFLESHAREAGFFGAQDGRASIKFRVLSQLVKA